MVAAGAVGLASVLLVDAGRRLGWRLCSPDVALALATTATLAAGAIVCLLEALRVWGGFSPLIIGVSALALWLATVYASRPYPGHDQPHFSREAWLYLGILVVATSAAALVLPEVRAAGGVARLPAFWVARSGAPGRLAAVPALAMIGAGSGLVLAALGRPIGMAAPIGVLLAVVSLLAPAGTISQDDLIALGSAAVLLGLGLAGLRHRPGRTGALVGGIASGLGIGSRSWLALIGIALAVMLIVEIVRTVSSPRWAVLAVSGFLTAAFATGMAWYLLPIPAAFSV